MKVNIEHREKKTGVFKKTTYYVVALKVDFSQEELAIINTRKLQDAIVLEREPWAGAANTDVISDDFWHLTIKKLMKEEDEYQCATPQDAKVYEGELVDGLKNLKGYLQQNEGIEEKSKSFEL